ncbi:nineteen complex-related protein 2-domain-containing protein [Podospora aff. communis PSN243]|uniref:Nineteen complex-related protein 2-domain-containing protein n=1 Tax=Podospora aff. communis PSN243 TaxID=3040156 RepID=A0AAV9GC35_9PEZI|nr:nineteen complex-related protein 2-domain-containing protein [Podospora aff. communis PSN243]
MSSFGPKRKARIIQTLDDEDTEMGTSLVGEEEKKQVPIPQGPIKFGRSKPAKSSSLRKSINFNDDDATQSGDGGTTLGGDAGTASAGDGDDEEPGPVVIRPALSRSSSTKQKKRHSTARLSFGPDNSLAQDNEDAAVEIATPKKSLGHRAFQNNALRKSASLQNLRDLPTRFGSEEDRPRYSKEYLQELQSSTPNTPQKDSSRSITDDGDAMDLDQSELEGALIVPSTDLSRRSPSAQTQEPPSATHILTESEIRERKERRARLAHESDFLSLDASDTEEPPQSNHITLSLKPKKAPTRLIAEDEDLGEGYDEFVSDGGLALGRNASIEASRRHRQEMADLINAAEAPSDDSLSDSEAERREAYEAAQRRAGMDGLHRHDENDDADAQDSVIPRMKPLPDVDEVIARMRGLVQGLEDEVTRKRNKIAELEKEKEEIAAREKEVQEVLNQAGAKYQALVGSAGDVSKLVTQSPLRPLPPGIGGDVPMERGLESFGTPTKRPDAEEMA